MKLVNWKTFSEIYLSAEWRLSNWEYFLYTALWCITYLLLIKILEYIEIFVPQYVLGLSTWGLAIFWLVCRIFLWIKRCHDLWHSWAWLLWYLCPIFNIVFPFILYFEKWDKTENKYWKVPEALSKRIKIITVFVVIMRRLWVWCLYYTMFLDIKSKLPEISQQANQELTYEILTQEDLLQYFWSGNIENFNNYRIPKSILEKDSDLIELIIWSLSLWTIEEKQQRFDLYTIMNDEQKENLRDILIREKQRLAEIEAKYQTEGNIEIDSSVENTDLE